MPDITRRRAVTVAVLTATFLAALDTSVVGTAMPTIIGSLGGLSLYSWAFSAYLLTSTTTVPVCGRLADIYGRKPVFLVGAALFLAGSALCGTAVSMEQLIFFRAVQGLGAGAILPASLTVVGDIYSLEDRAKIQGMLSGVWGVSAILGPVVGGILVEKLDWRWVFYVNLPFGVASMLLFALFLDERITLRRQTIDVAGTVVMTVAVTLLMLGLLEVGQNGSGMALPAWPLLGTSVVLLLVFLWHESRVEMPLLPLSLFTNRVVAVSNSAGFLVGAALVGLSSFVPPFVQGVLGGTAINAGAVLAPMSIAWPIGSTLSGRTILRHGYRPLVLLGMGLILVGSLPMLLLGPNSTRLAIMPGMAVVGLGMGFSTTAFLVAVQSSVGWEQRGVATASVQFFRSIGGAVGVSAMGALMNGWMHEGMHQISAAFPSMLDPTAGVSAGSFVLDPAARAGISPDLLSAMRALLANSLHATYAAVALVAAVGVLLAFLFPGGSARDHAHASSRRTMEEP